MAVAGKRRRGERRALEAAAAEQITLEAERGQPWQCRQAARPALLAMPRRALTPHTVAWMVPRRARKRSVEDQASLAGLRRCGPELDEAVALAAAFVGLVRDRAPDRLDSWLERVGESSAQRLRGFAKRLWADYDAVRAAVTLNWSSGQSEGQINRLKTIKRQMYGRAGLDLLGRRFLLAA